MYSPISHLQDSLGRKPETHGFPESNTVPLYNVITYYSQCITVYKHVYIYMYIQYINLY